MFINVAGLVKLYVLDILSEFYYLLTLCGCFKSHGGGSRLKNSKVVLGLLYGLM